MDWLDERFDLTYNYFVEYLASLYFDCFLLKISQFRPKNQEVLVFSFFQTIYRRTIYDHVENFGASFNDKRVEDNFNRELILFCRMMKAIAVKEGTPITVDRLLNEVKDEMALIFDWQDELSKLNKEHKIRITGIERKET